MTEDKFTRTGLGVYYHEMKGGNIRQARESIEDEYLDRVSEGLEKILRLLVSHAYADDPLATGLGKILAVDIGVSIDEFEFIDPVDLRKDRGAEEDYPF